jgi:glycosyltransferase involved in cell wall biosynthesis
MGEKIVFLNTWHYSFDDRVFFHQAKSLEKQGYCVEIISTKEILITEVNTIKIDSYNDIEFTQKQKIEAILHALEIKKPDIIIGDTPLAIIATAIYKRNNKKTSIVYDVTEWYPSKKNLINTKGLHKVLKFIVLTVINIYAGFKTDYFIFGEHFKSIPFRILYFWKKHMYLPYYPDCKYIQYFSPRQNENENEFSITYSGIITREKGINSVIESVEKAAQKSPFITFKLCIIGYFPTDEDKVNYLKQTYSLSSNLKIDLQDFMSFPNFCESIGNTDLFLDLRKRDLENSYCLPIKLFYYFACGRPVIYSDLNSIKNAIPDINFGYLISPEKINEIAEAITNYITNNDIYLQHCENALQLSRKYFNWNLIEKDFTNFIATILKTHK